MSIAISVNLNALGDTIAAIPTINKLAKAHDAKITVFSSHPYLFKNHPSVEKSLSIDSSKEGYRVYNVPFIKEETINSSIVGFKHSHIDIRQFHALSLGFSLTPKEMETDLYIEEAWDVEFQDYVVIHPTNTWDSRTWDQKNWQDLIYQLNSLNIPVVAIGKKAIEYGHNATYNKTVMNIDIPYGINLMDHPDSTIDKIRGLLKNAKALITMDSGILHVGGTTDVHIIQLGSSINPKFRAPYRKGSQDYKYNYVNGKCDLFCASNLKYNLKEWKTIQGIPPLATCLEKKQTFECHPTSNDVIKILDKLTPKDLPKLLIVTPHLSTGGSPQYILDYIKHNKHKFSIIKLIEFTNFSSTFTIQKNKIISLLGKENVITLGEFGVDDDVFATDKEKLLPLLKKYTPDVIWMNEFPEAYEYKKPPKKVMDVLYSKDRNYKIIETTHYNAFNFKNKKFIPDEFMFCSKKHLAESQHINIPKTVWEVPINKKSRPNRESTLISLGLDPSKYHILNVGLVSPNKNQKFIFDIAEQTTDLPIQYHFIGNHCFFDDTGITPTQKNLSNCKLWGERSDVDKFMSCMDLYLFPSKKELNPLTVKEALSWGMEVVANQDNNYTNQYKNISNFKLIQDIDVLEYITTKIPTAKKLKTKFNSNHIKISFQHGIKVNVSKEALIPYTIKFFNDKTNKLIWEDTIEGGMWTSPSVKYYIKWRVEVWQFDNKVYEHILDLTNKRVIIHLDSKAVGDTIAWFPYVEEFRKKHNCHVICSTFHNNWFETQYPEIEFIKPGTACSNIYAIYNIGWFNDSSKNPNNPVTIPLQKAATDILGLSYKEIKPKTSFKLSKSTIKSPYVALSIQSTSQAKYWNHIGGWQQVVNHLNSKGYKVVCIDKYSMFGSGSCMNKIPKNVVDKTGCSFEEAASIIKGAEFFLGISSGLSWMSWAMGTYVIMVSSFSKPLCEFTTNCTRIYNDDEFSGYYNNPQYKFNPGDWNWNPFLSISTPEEWHDFESITPKQVINEINKLL
jgi:autotransporter strand-loop-strand O-heptosyltransferase